MLGVSRAVGLVRSGVLLSDLSLVGGTLVPNCCASMKPDTNLGGIITTQTEVFYDKTTSLFFSRV